MTLKEQVNLALVEYREMLQVDSADLELLDVTDGVARIKLVFGAATCADCVLPKNMLESILLDGLRGCEGNVARVVVEDPRDADDNATTD